MHAGLCGYGKGTIMIDVIVATGARIIDMDFF